MECPNELARFLRWAEDRPLCARRFILACGSAAVPPGHFLYLANAPPGEGGLCQPLAFVRSECCLCSLSVCVPPRPASAAVHLIQSTHKPISNLFCILITLISNDNQHTNLQFTVTAYLPFLFTLATTIHTPCCPLSAIICTIPGPPARHPLPLALVSWQGSAIVWPLCSSMQSFDDLSLVKICDSGLFSVFSNCSVH